VSYSFLLLGASHSDFYIAHAIKAMGYTLYTSGSYLAGLSACLSDKHFPANYSQYDACLDLVKRISPDYLIPSANDFSYLTTVALNARHRSVLLDSYNTAILLHHKDQFRLLCKEIDIPSPELYRIVRSVHDIDDSVLYPCILKPTDLTGGKSIHIVYSQSHLMQLLPRVLGSGRSGKCVLEEIVNGQLYSISSFVKSGRIVSSYLDREYLRVSTYGVAASSSELSSSERSILNSTLPFIQRIIEYLSLVDGLLHSQVMISSTGNPYIIEVTRRMPGDLYSIPVEATSGVNHSMAFLSELTGRSEFNQYSLFGELPCLCRQFLGAKSATRIQHYGNLTAVVEGFRQRGHMAEFVTGNRLGCVYDADKDPKGVVFSFE